MRRSLHLILSRRGSEFAELAVSLPFVTLITFALITLTLAGFAGVSANNAANYGARVGSVRQQGQASAAYAAAMQSIDYARIGDYSVLVSGGGFPGAQIAVQVNWSVPSLLDPLLELVGGTGIGPKIKGTAVSAFRQEGW